MNKISKVQATEKMPFEPSKIEIVAFDTKDDIVCASPIVGEEDPF